MPQGDFVNFSSTAWAVGLSFVVGYFVFVGVWLPRLLLTLKARTWLTGFTTAGAVTPAGVTPTVGVSTFLAAAAVVAPADGVWPETFLFCVEFAALTLVVSTLAVPTTRVVLPPAGVTAPAVVNPAGATTLVVNLLGLWAAHRAFVWGHLADRVHTATTRAAATVAAGLPTPGVARLKMVAAPTRDE